MIDRLHKILPHLEDLPPDIQEEVANYIEAVEREAFVLGRLHILPSETSQTDNWEDPVGSLSDLPDDMFEELDRIRHANPPTPPIENL